MSGTTSPLEASWTIVACIGLLFSVVLAVQGWLDFRFVERAISRIPPLARRWGPRWWVALSALVANTALCLVWGGFAFIGWVAMQFPPPPPTAQQAVSNQWAGWALLTMEAVLAAVQAWHLFVRGRVDESMGGHP